MVRLASPELGSDRIVGEKIWSPMLMSASGREVPIDRSSFLAGFGQNGGEVDVTF